MTANALLDIPFSARGDRIADEVAELRSRASIRKVRTITGDEAWLVSSYALCTQVLEDRRFSLPATAAPGAPRLNALTVPTEVVNNMGNITDAGLRKAVMRAITPKAPGLEQFLRDTANSLLDKLIAEGAPADLRNDFADPLAVALHCRVLGIPQQDGPKLLRSLSFAFMSSADPIPAAKINWDRDIEYMAGLLDNPSVTTGLMGELSRLRKDPSYSHVSDELFATVGVTFFGAGVISTGCFLTAALISLMHHPHLRTLLIERPELIPAGVEELLRINLSFADGLPRLATADIQVGDVLVRKGELVLVLLEGANFDPERFANPQNIELDRPNPTAHLAFGRGQHTCPGSALGRRHAQIAIETLLQKMPTFDLAVPIEQLVWRTRFARRIPERLPVLW
ncbi:cytochrome P450 [Mycobacterium ostraviense]|uniref:Cytochrome n=1 Tax=Mycobacterium ostraviense TaxID=2738409 RepID=A0A163Y909_9MYCO|nr:cytochrome P450 [Mycobacterium ostraviense]KZS60199.1 cytochrome [Mycobacterium ostraviense]UGT93323.1 cytochrome P450 [Mycobacterium ostraviense]